MTELEFSPSGFVFWTRDGQDEEWHHWKLSPNIATNLRLAFAIRYILSFDRDKPSRQPLPDWLNNKPCFLNAVSALEVELQKAKNIKANHVIEDLIKFADDCFN